MVNEKRLIDYQKAKEIVLDILRGKITTVTAVQLVTHMKDATVDAVEVVHGHWEIRPNPYRVFAHEYACSVCGGWKHKLSYEHENMNYCPNCGAKMDGGKEDG